MPLIFCRQLHTYLRCSKNAVTPSPFPSCLRLRTLSLSLSPWTHKSTDPSVVRPPVRRPPHRALADKRFSSFQNVATSARNVLSSSCSCSALRRAEDVFSSEMPNQEELLPFCPPARLSGNARVRARALRGAADGGGRPGGRQFEGRERMREGEREKTHIVFLPTSFEGRPRAGRGGRQLFIRLLAARSPARSLAA